MLIIKFINIFLLEGLLVYMTPDVMSENRWTFFLFIYKDYPQPGPTNINLNACYIYLKLTRCTESICFDPMVAAPVIYFYSHSTLLKPKVSVSI